MNTNLKITAKRAILVFPLLVIAPTIAQAMAPRAIIGEGRWSAGAEISTSQTDMEAVGTHQETVSNTLFRSFSQYQIKNLKSNQLFAQIGYGIHDNWDIYARLGLATAKGDLKGETNPAASATSYGTGNENYELDSSASFAWGIGSRVTFVEEKEASWGATFQMTWFDPKQSRSTWNNTATEYVTADIDLKYWEMQIAAGPTLNFDSFWLYFGPFLHYINGDLKMTGTWNDGGTFGSIKGDYDVREKTIIGGFIGSQFVLADNAYFYVDGQATGNAWGLGAGFVYRTE